MKGILAKGSDETAKVLTSVQGRVRWRPIGANERAARGDR